MTCGSAIKYFHLNPEAKLFVPKEQKTLLSQLGLFSEISNSQNRRCKTLNNASKMTFSPEKASKKLFELTLNAKCFFPSTNVLQGDCSLHHSTSFMAFMLLLSIFIMNAVLKLSSSINKLSKTISSGNIKCIDYFDFLSYDETILASTSSDESSKESNFSDISNTSSLTMCINASPSYLNVIYPLSECVNGDGPQTESLDLNYLALQNSSLNPIAKPFIYTERGNIAFNVPTVSHDCTPTHELNPSAKPFVSTFLNTSSYPGNIDGERDSPYSILQNLRVKNVDKILFGHININSVRNKFDLLADLIKDQIDIILISETKLDGTFPNCQFRLDGYSFPPIRFDRTANGGGLLLFLRCDLPFKHLPLVFGGIECIILDVTISKKKWFLMGTYNPKKSMISKYISVLEKNLCHYLSLYDNVFLFGDFNSEIREEALADFCSLYNLKSLIKVPTCFKSVDNPSCIDLILTNKPHSFQNSTVVETGLSDFHMLTVTVLKTSFRKRPPKLIKYRNYKQYSHFNFQNEFTLLLTGIDLNHISNDDYVSLFMEVLNRHAPLKQRYVRANDQPFVTKELRKEHMKRSRLKNIYLRNKTDASAKIYKRQRNKCVSLLKKAKKSFFGNLNPSAICDNKNFWKTVKPLFSEQAVSTDNLTLIENNVMVNDDTQIAEIFNDNFSNAVKNLNIEYYECPDICQNIDPIERDDPILSSIRKYKNHPSILKIKEIIPENACFSFKPTDLDAVIKEIGNLNESKSSPIESIPVKILKDNYDIISTKIHIDFNSSIKTGLFPQNQKLADVSPVFKTVDKHLKGNYRPVSILPA